MMLIIHEITGGGHWAEIARADDIYSAVEILPGNIVLIEEDADHPGCYDALMQQAGAVRQFTIEPAPNDA